MIFSLIGIVILIYALVDYKKAFLIFLIFKMILDNNVSFILPGIPPFVSLNTVMVSSFIAMFFFFRKRIAIDRTEFPLKIPFILLSLSWFISNVFSLVGFSSSSFISYIFTVMDTLVLVWVMWCVVSDKKDIIFLLKFFTIAFLLAAIYAFFEKATMTNPIVDYKTSLAREAGVDYSYEHDTLYGRGYRVRSIFNGPIGAGINWGLYIIMIMVMIVEYNWRKNRLALLSALLCIPCVFFANTRSCIMFLFIGCLSFVNFKNKRFNKLFVILGIIIVLAIPYLSEYSNLVDSLFHIFDESANNEMGGSSIEMRQTQLAAVIGIWSQSPIWGMGQGFNQVMSGSLIEAARALESVWFVALANYGILGLISYIVLMYYSVIKIPREYKSRPLFFLSLAYWITMSATTTPALMEYYYYLIMFIIIKLQAFKNKLQTNPTCRKLW